jgi:hypothetical protein
MSGNTLAGGEDTTSITFRVPSHLKEQFKNDVDNMSATLQEYVRDHVNKSDVEQPTPRDPPTEQHLARAYEQLCEIVSREGVVKQSTAKRMLSGGPRKCSKEDVVHNLLHPLRKRGYIHRTSDVYGNVSWHIHGWDDER